MPTAYEDLYTATKAIVAAASAASTTTLTQAGSNYGTDFSIPSGTGLYQVKVQPEQDYPRGTVNYPRATVTILIHHYRSSLVNEEAFLHSTMFQVAERVLVGSVWTAESGIFGLDPNEEPAIEDGERVGNVISFQVTAVVLMNAT